MRKLLMIVAVLALVAAACGDDDDAADSTTVAPATEAPATEAPATPAPTTEAPAGGLAAAASDLGEILVDAEGRTLYLFTPDVDGVSVCYGDCESAWPPFYEDALGTPGDGIDGSLLGTAPRDDGTVQVTYGGWPLYYFAGDSAPGDTNGQGVNDVWYVLGADAQGIGLPQAAAAGLSLAGTDLGEILVDGDGRTLYLFTPDVDGVSVCYGDCESAWPPFYEDALGTPGDGIDGSLLGTAPRDDGTVQVTYGGWPLYYFAGDAAAGDTNGQGVNDVWYVLGADAQGIGVPGGGLSLSSSGLGEILVDGEGRTLYLFTVDADGVSACYDGCEQAWPPFYQDALGTVGDGINGGLLGTTDRDDGTVQVTYAGWPLYYFANDAAAGDTNGQGVNDVWYVVDAAGQAIGN